MQMEPITPECASTMPALFRERARRSSGAVAYRYYDDQAGRWESMNWQAIARIVVRWQSALRREGLRPGDRVALMLRNSPWWVVFDQAALGMGLVTVPLYMDDRAENVAYILDHAGAKLLLVQGASQWAPLLQCGKPLPELQRIVVLEAGDGGTTQTVAPIVVGQAEWLAGADETDISPANPAPEDLASIVYTSGTTGRPKGVMLSHRNFLSNAWAALQCAAVGDEDLFLSFLPLSHTLERTVGYLLPMMAGAPVAYARSVPLLGEDLLAIQPTVLISVPRIYERVYGKIRDGLKEKPPLARQLFQQTVEVGWARFEYRQGRGRWSPRLLLWPLLDRLVASRILAKLGGRIRVAICGGAALSPEVAKHFIGLGLPLLQGYGLTEASPVVTANRLDNNIPASIGLALPGVEIRIGDNDELQTRSDCVMLGYWRNEVATREVLSADGWLSTGDKARIDTDGHVYITGRIKDIIVLANGEKVPPADMEMAIVLDALFEQAVVLGEGRPYLSVLLVLNAEHWRRLADSLSVDPDDPAALRDEQVMAAMLTRVATRIRDFPGFAQIRSVSLYLDPWTVDNELLTPTLKVRRARVIDRFASDIEAMYAGHR